MGLEGGTTAGPEGRTAMGPEGASSHRGLSSGFET